MQYGLLTYTHARRDYNVGDNIQSLAARQYLPRVDCYIDREQMANFDGPETKIILNGWFTHEPDNWVPSPAIKPLFISFHLNSSVAGRVLSEKGIQYLKKHSPIGCRDRHTMEVLQSRGIPAYFSGCLTLTLNGYQKPSPVRTKNYIVDPLFSCRDFPDFLRSPQRFLKGLKNPSTIKVFKKTRLLKNIFKSEFIDSAYHRRHVLPSAGVDIPTQFSLAESYLGDYADARLVVTSRIHCALPCLAMGVPVIFVNAFDHDVDTCRFDGLLDLFNRIDVSPRGVITNNFALNGKIDGKNIPKNSTKHVPLAEKLRAKCEEFIKS